MTAKETSLLNNLSLKEIQTLLWATEFGSLAFEMSLAQQVQRNKHADAAATGSSSRLILTGC